METYSLLQLNQYVKKMFALNFEDPIWVTAELVQLGSSRGHHYLTLVSKEDETNQVQAQASAAIWSSQYVLIKKKLGSALDQVLVEGMDISLLVRVDFHERYGYKLIVEDIDAGYTLGKLAIKRQQTIEKLRKMELMEKNEMLTLPTVLQRIAVISSATAAGYIDFVSHLSNNSYGYFFDVSLFQAAMQGMNLEREVIQAIDTINENKEKYDAIVIIRGGGGKMDLSGFDGLELCIKAANAELPILTGIGHDIDETILDMVAHSYFKTPTAVADFVIQQAMEYESDMLYQLQQIQNLTQQIIKESELDLNQLSHTINSVTMHLISEEKVALNTFELEAKQAVKIAIKQHKLQLDNATKLIQANDPVNVLKKGYSITYKEDQPVTTDAGLVKGDKITTLLSKGKFSSIVE